MPRIIFILMTALCLWPRPSMADAEVDLAALTEQCRVAAKASPVIGHNFAYKVLHTVHYTGWSGDADHPDLTYPVAMEIRWAGSSKQGHYWFLDRPHQKHAVRVTSDAGGNIRMAATAADGAAGFSFRGRMTAGVIKGMWEHAAGTVAFAFYAVGK